MKRLEDKDIINIRFLYKTTDIRQHMLGDMYNVDPSHISDIVNNKKRKILYSYE